MIATNGDDIFKAQFAFITHSMKADKKGYVIMLLSRVARIARGFVIPYMLVVCNAPSAAIVITSTTAYVGLISPMIIFHVHSGVQRFAVERKIAVNRLFIAFFIFIASISLLLSASNLAFVNFLSEYSTIIFGVENRLGVHFLAIAILANSVFLMELGRLLGEGDPYRASLFSLARWIGPLAVFMIILFVIGPWEALLAYIISELFIVLAITVFGREKWSYRNSSEREDIVELIKFSLPMLPSAILVFGLFSILRVSLSKGASPDVVLTMNLLFQIYSGIVALLMALNQVHFSNTLRLVRKSGVGAGISRNSRLIRFYYILIPLFGIPLVFVSKLIIGIYTENSASLVATSGFIIAAFLLGLSQVSRNEFHMIRATPEILKGYAIAYILGVLVTLANWETMSVERIGLVLVMSNFALLVVHLVSLRKYEKNR